MLLFTSCYIFAETSKCLLLSNVKKGSICNQDSFAVTALLYSLLGALAALCSVRVLPFSLDPAAPLASLHSV